MGSNFIFSWTHNEITSLFTHARVIDLVQGTGYSLVGYPVNSIFSIPFAGLNGEGLPTFMNEMVEELSLVLTSRSVIRRRLSI